MVDQDAEAEVGGSLAGSIRMTGPDVPQAVLSWAERCQEGTRRFEEFFGDASMRGESKRVGGKRVPVGAKPWGIVADARAAELIAAMARYHIAARDEVVPLDFRLVGEWAEELASICAAQAARTKGKL